MSEPLSRGLSQAEACRYLGISKREFEANWRPKLSSMRAGTRRIFDRLALDALFSSRLTVAAPAHENAPVRSASEQAILAAVLRSCRSRARPRGTAS